MIEHLAPTDEPCRIVAQLWSWYEDEVISTLESFLLRAPELSGDDGRASLRLLIVDLATAGTIACNHWIQVLDIIHLEGVLGRHATKNGAGGASGTLFERAQMCLDRILTAKKAGVEPFSLQVLVTTAEIQGALLSLLGQASSEFVARYG